MTRSAVSPGMAGILAGLVLAANAAALEPDELRPGMKPEEVVSVYTSHRSCSNAAFTEGPGLMAWDAQLYGRNARVEVVFSQNLSGMVAIRIYLEAGEDGKDVMDELADEQTRAYGPPAIDAAGSLRWDSGAFSTTLATEVVAGYREIVLAKTR